MMARSCAIPTLDRAAGLRPRYFIHGAVAIVAVTAFASVALQPRTQVNQPVQEAVAADSQSNMAFVEVVSEEAPAQVTAVDEESAPAEAPAAVEPPPAPRMHTVEEGESLRMLAAKYGIAPETILATNDLPDPDLLKVGQELIMLPINGVLHTLAEGESIRRLASVYGVDMSEIVAANDLGGNPDLLQPGVQLVIPGAATVLAGNRSAIAQGGDAEQRAATIGNTRAIRTVPSTRTYEVEPGDTLNSIANTFGVDVETIMASNGIGNPNAIKPGVELRILPVKGVEYEVKPGETLADIAWKFQVDLGLLLDYNDLDNPDFIRVGGKLVLPGGRMRADAEPPAPAVAAPRTGPAAPAPAVPKPAPKPAAKPSAPAAPAPRPSVGSGGGNIVSNAMKYVGYRYVFGGTSPAGFDCSGFVFYIHNSSGSPVGRGMWQQYNGGGRISQGQLQPGDTVFFANTYMPGLSHNGIYIGNGQFIHASDPGTGVTISSMGSAYWSSRFVGATRLW